MADEVKDTLLTQDEGQQADTAQEDTQETQDAQGEQEQQQETAKSWRDELLPDDLKGLPLFEKYQSPQDALKAFAEAQKLIGKKGIIPPSKDASEEEKKEFIKKVHEALGAEYPQDPADYELPEVEDLPEDLSIDENLVEGFKDVAHKLGLNKEQTAQLYEWYMQSLASSYNRDIENIDRLREEAESQLRQKWGRAYESKVSLAKKFIDKFGTQGLKDKIKGVWGNDPDLIETLATAAENFSEDTLAGTPKRAAMTPEEARSEIWKIKADPNHPFYLETHPEHELAKKRMEELYLMAYPELARETGA